MCVCVQNHQCLKTALKQTKNLFKYYWLDKFKNNQNFIFVSVDERKSRSLSLIMQSIFEENSKERLLIIDLQSSGIKWLKYNYNYTSLHIKQRERDRRREVIIKVS